MPSKGKEKGHDMETSSELTELLMDWSRGDEQALERLLPLVYGDLRRKAAQYLRKERGHHTLQPTALVHEAYFRLVEQKNVDWRNRSHFYAIAAQMMRRILVDHARKGAYEKRGGGADLLSLDEAVAVSVDRAPDLLALDDCLTDLSMQRPELAKLVEMRYFGGLSNEEIGEVLGMSIPTVTRRWRIARAWIYGQLLAEAGDAA